MTSAVKVRFRVAAMMALASLGVLEVAAPASAGEPATTSTSSDATAHTSAVTSTPALTATELPAPTSSSATRTSRATQTFTIPDPVTSTSSSSLAPQPQPTVTTSSGSDTTSSSTTSSSGGPAIVVTGPAQPQQTTGHRLSSSTTTRTTSSAAKGAAPGAASLSQQRNPLAGVLPYLQTLPGPGTSVPDFFIANFDVPLFLLPIYQAAADAYGVPWQVLAAINEVETDYGRDLNVSTAGAEGWMQFLPTEWKAYGVDATAAGFADPYNPADAIFAAARYLQAAGAQQNIARAIFAYNHSSTYVQSVLLRAQLLEGVPDSMVDALTSIADGHFPIQPHDRPTYTPDPTAPTTAASAATAAAPTIASAMSSAPSNTAAIYAARGAAVVAVSDGTIVGIGNSRKLGRYIELRDGAGDVYTYGNLADVVPEYPVPKPPALGTLPKATNLPPAPGSPHPQGPASAGGHTVTSGTTGATGAVGTTGANGSTSPAPAPGPTEPDGVSVHATFAGVLPNPVGTLLTGSPTTTAHAARHDGPPHTRTVDLSIDHYFTADFGLRRDQLTLRPMRIGAQVLAGSILGHLGSGSVTARPHLAFQLRPAGPKSGAVDPRPFLDTWSELETTNLHRHPGSSPLIGPDSLSATAGRVLTYGKAELTRLVLSDPRIGLDACTKSAIAAGDVDRRVLGILEYLVINGQYPTAASAGTALTAGHCTPPAATSAATTAATTANAAAAHRYAALRITAVNGTPLGNRQGPGSVAQSLLLRLIALRGHMRPGEIVSRHAIPGAPNSVGLPTAGGIEIVFDGAAPSARAASAPTGFVLSSHRWDELVSHLQTIPQPIVPADRSPAAFSDGGSVTVHHLRPRPSGHVAVRSATAPRHITATGASKRHR